MRVPQYAMRTLAVFSLLGLMTGCGGNDSTAPDAPFDPSGTTSDIAAIESAYESDAMYGFQSAMPAIDSTLGETGAAVALRAAPSKITANGKAGAREYAGALARLYIAPTAGMRPVSGRAAILDEHLGVTFVRNAETLEYEASDRTGAPSNGVRFIVYTVNPISGQPVTPLQEVGYADVEVTESTNSASVRIELVSGNVTYLDYAVAATGSQTAVAVNVAGFVSNGEDRVNFDLDIHVNSDSSVLSFDYVLSVPTRGNFRMALEEELNLEAATVVSSLELRGPHGTVTITGNWAENAGTYNVGVNGEAFATISVAQGSEPVITGADGEPLTEEELHALQEIYLSFLGGFDFFEDLLDPIVSVA
jgi:hypothetical protein